MLSYRHAFHAGNFADLLKHCILVEILDYLTKKESPFEYIDTHAGAGLYNLQSPNAQKLQEFETGIGKVNARDFPELFRYFETIRSFNDGEPLKFYPGSPAIASCFLRAQDRAWLFELHPQDFALLSENMARRKNVKVSKSDGFDGLKAQLPPRARRALILIDPSYEIKSDYSLVAEQLLRAHKKFSQGIYALWYPVVDRTTITKLKTKVRKSGINNIQCFELGVRADAPGRGMTSSGMIIINPPWTLFDKMSKLLPKLAEAISEDANTTVACEVIAGDTPSK